MKHLLSSLVAIASLALSAVATRGEEHHEGSATIDLPAVQKDLPGMTLVQGPKTVKLGSIAELKLPEGYAFVPPESLDKFFELTHNVRGGQEVGVVLSPTNWMLFFDYANIGYVKDDEKKDLDAKKLYQHLEENQVTLNKDLNSRGWDQLKMRGWATAPYYDEKSHHLKWAFKISSSRDDYKAVWINEAIRLLGREGVMNLTLVADNATFKEAETQAEDLLTKFAYLPGQKYAEFRNGDKIAKYGLTALVLGGAGAIAFKSGLLAKFGILLLKMWKVIVIAGIAVASFLGRLWKKVVGKETT